MNHLTDEKIQNYLDGILAAGEKEQIESHMNECQVCKNEIDAYKSLYSTLSKESGFDLDAHFSRSVISEIENQASGKIQEKLLAAFMVLFGVIAVITTSFYYVDFTQLENDLKIEKPGFALPNFSGIFEQFQSLLPQTSFNFNLILIGAIVLIALAVFDRFVLQNKYRVSTR